MGNVLTDTFWAGFRVFGSACGRIYRLLFGGMDRRLARRNQERLIADLRSALGKVQRLHGGEIRLDDRGRFPPPFDLAIVTVRFDEFTIRVVRGRDDLQVQVAPPYAPNDWQDLRVVLIANSDPEQHPALADLETLPQLGQLLLSEWDDLTLALAEPHYEATKQGLGRLYNMPLAKQWEIASERLRKTKR